MFDFDLTNRSFCVNKQIYFRKSGQKFLILSLDRINVIELEGVAFFIWKNLQKPISYLDLLKKVKKEYNVSEVELEKDLKAWLKQAISEKIVEKI